jgi:hypothetical protein
MSRCFTSSALAGRPNPGCLLEFVCARSAPPTAKHSASQNIFPDIFLGIGQLAALL